MNPIKYSPQEEPTNFLPNGFYNRVGNECTMTAKHLRSTLLYTEGRVFIQGRMCDLKKKNLGCGVYRVWSEECPFPLKH